MTSIQFLGRDSKQLSENIRQLRSRDVRISNAVKRTSDKRDISMTIKNTNEIVSEQVKSRAKGRKRLRSRNLLEDATIPAKRTKIASTDTGKGLVF